jgi:hypothetical protein
VDCAFDLPLEHAASIATMAIADPTATKPRRRVPYTLLKVMFSPSATWAVSPVAADANADIVAFTVDEIKAFDGRRPMYAVTVWHRNGLGGHVPTPGAL